MGYCVEANDKKKYLFKQFQIQAVTRRNVGKVNVVHTF